MLFRSAGTATAMTKVAANSLGIAENKIKFVMGDSDLSPGPTQGGSTTTSTLGSGVHLACESLKDLLKDLAIELVDAFKLISKEKIGVEAMKVFSIDDKNISVTAEELVKKKNIPFLDIVKTSPGLNPREIQRATNSFSVHFVKVHVHSKTNEIQLKHVVTTGDAGKIISEQTARSQMLGGAVGGVEVGLDAAKRRALENQYNSAYQDLLNQLAVRSVDRSGMFVPESQQIPPVQGVTPAGGIGQTYAGEGTAIGPAGIRLSNAERRRLEQEALTREVPQPAEVAPEERAVGQYPPEGFGTGVIPSQQEVERRAAVRRLVADRNRAEAEARRAEAQGMVAANPQEEARIMAQLQEEEAAARVRMAEEENRIMAQLQAEQASLPLGRLEAAQESRYGAATRPIAPEPRQTLGMSPEVAQRLRDLRLQEQRQLQQINEAPVQVPEARQPAVQEGRQGAQGPSRVDRPTEVRQGAVPADVSGRAEGVGQTQPWQDESYRAGQLLAEKEFERGRNNPGLLRAKLPSDISAYEAELNAANALPTRSARSKAIFDAGQKYGWQAQ